MAQVPCGGPSKCGEAVAGSGRGRSIHDQSAVAAAPRVRLCVDQASTGELVCVCRHLHVRVRLRLYSFEYCECAATSRQLQLIDILYTYCNVGCRGPEVT